MNNRIVELRKALGLSQTEFAESLGITQNFISLVENGKRDFSSRTKNTLCALYKVNLIWLETGVGEMFDKERTDVELAESVADIYNNKNLSDEAKETIVRIMHYVSLLSEDNKETVLALANKLLENENKNRLQ